MDKYSFLIKFILKALTTYVWSSKSIPYCPANNFIFLAQKTLSFLMFYLEINQRLCLLFLKQWDQWGSLCDTFLGSTRKLKWIWFDLILSEMLAVILAVCIVTSLLQYTLRSLSNTVFTVIPGGRLLGGTISEGAQSSRSTG